MAAASREWPRAPSQSLLEGVHVPEFVPREDVRIKESDDDRTEEGSDEDEEVGRRQPCRVASVAVRCRG